MIDSTASITGASLEAGIGRPRAVQARGGDGFVQALRQELERTGGRQIAFSKHAMERAEERGIEVTPNLLDRLTDSVERAEAKGATNILALDQSLAFIINVPNGRVITTMSQDVLGDVRLTGPRRRETENTKSKGDLKHGIDRSNERGNFRAEGTHGGIEYSGQQCGQCKYLWL